MRKKVYSLKARIRECTERIPVLEALHGRVVQIIFKGSQQTYVFGDGKKYYIDFLSGCFWPGDLNVLVESTGNYIIDIDSENATSNRSFRVTKDGQTTILFKLNEDGSLTFSNGMTVSTLGVLAGATVADPTVDQGIASKKYGDDTFAPIAKGVTNGNTHDHAGGDGNQIDHTGLSSKGTNTHAQIDTHVAAASPHSGHLSNISEDTSPQLGGDLDLNSKKIDFPTTANVSDCKDEDDMASDSATMLVTQQSVKAYVDGKHTSYDTGWVSCSDWTNQHLGTALGGNVVHNLGKPISDLLIKVLFSTLGGDGDSFEIIDSQSADWGGDAGVVVQAVDNNNFIVQTGAAGFMKIEAAGGFSRWDGENTYYKIKVWVLG